jgi:putative membrane protein
MGISKEDHERIARAIHSAEAKTSGQIVCVLAQASSHTTALPVFIAAVASLVMPWLLITFTAMTVHRILSLQVVVFLALLMLFCLPRVRVALMPRKARRAIAHRAAMEQFTSRGIGQRKDRSGILIFVSLAERYARIIADDQIAARVAQSEWQAAVNALVAHMRDGRIADGFITAINLCGNELAKHFPRTATSNDAQPDRIYLI